MPDFAHKHAKTKHPVLDEISQRWSPYVYEPKPVEREKLQSCLEAARWSASSYNEQPWRFILATRNNENQFSAALNCLLEANRGWAKDAGVLLLTVYATSFAYNGKPNRVAFHDVGLAAANLSLQAQHLGLHVHQMAGVDADVVRSTYGIPEGFEVGTAIAIGYAGSRKEGPLAERDQGPRDRKQFEEIVFADKWENPAGI